MPPKLRQIRKKLDIPIYNAVVWIIVVDDISKERKEWEYLFGAAPKLEDYDALCSYSGGHCFGLFFERKYITLKTISHEIFHLTHRILDWAGANFDSTHHEQGALLNGYLTEMVYRKIGWSKYLTVAEKPL